MTKREWIIYTSSEFIDRIEEAITEEIRKILDNKEKVYDEHIQNRINFWTEYKK